MAYLLDADVFIGKEPSLRVRLLPGVLGLHNAGNARVFDSVIVVTDRIVLDQQLQDTIYQFDHKHGVVRKVDEISRQLAEALGEQGSHRHHHVAEVPVRVPPASQDGGGARRTVAELLEVVEP